jgi:sigma-B regulation protein RsbU (phosphoserine phosphatase)
MTGQAVLPEISSEWVCAWQVQTRFMQRSRSNVDGLDYAARCRQMHAIGGDFYDFLPLADDRLAIAVGDASGKGLPGALMVSNLQSSVRTASFFAGENLPLTLEAVNRQVYESSLVDHYATLFYSILDIARHTLRYVNAGHPPPILIRRDNSIVLLEAGGAPVGMFPTWKYEEGVVELQAGDVILGYTDGVVEATNRQGEEWGLDGLRNSLATCSRRSCEDIVEMLFAALDEYTDGAQADDATIAALRIL